MHSETRNYVPEPAIVMFGCGPHLPHRPGDPCPVCKGLIGSTGRDTDARTYCARCDALSPKNEQRCASQRQDLAALDREAKARKAAQTGFLRVCDDAPSESIRRRIWNGHRFSLVAADPEPTNLALEGRKWLTEKGWEPDWSTTLPQRRRALDAED